MTNYEQYWEILYSIMDESNWGRLRKNRKWYFYFYRNTITEILYSKFGNKDEEIFTDMNSLIEFCKEVNVSDELIVEAIKRSFRVRDSISDKIKIWLSYYNKNITTEDLLMLKLEI